LGGAKHFRLGEGERQIRGGGLDRRKGLARRREGGVLGVIPFFGVFVQLSSDCGAKGKNSFSEDAPQLAEGSQKKRRFGSRG